MEMQLIWIPLFIVLIMATVTDLKTMTISNRLTRNGLFYFLLIRLMWALLPYTDYLVGVLVGAGFLWLINVIHPNTIGGGDIKLMAVVGAALGWQMTIPFLAILFLSSWIFVAVYRHLKRKTIVRFPLAPFFLLSGAVLFWVQWDVFKVMLQMY